MLFAEDAPSCFYCERAWTKEEVEEMQLEAPVVPVGFRCLDFVGGNKDRLRKFRNFLWWKTIGNYGF